MLKVKRNKLLLLLLPWILYSGCVAPAIISHPIDTTENFFSHVFGGSTKTGNIASPNPLDKAKAFATPEQIKTTKEETTIITRAIEIVSQPSSPKEIMLPIHWLYIASLVCLLAAVIAGFTTHFLAAAKFAFAGVAGAVIGKVFSVILGSFVLATFASFAVGLIIAWYIIEGRGKGGGLSLTTWIDTQAHIAANDAAMLASKIKSVQTVTIPVAVPVTVAVTPVVKTV